MLTFCSEQCTYALFTDPQISFFINFFIKNGSHITIHTFKNYFATVFSVFSFQFQQNKFYPNTPLDISQSTESENRPVYYEVKWKTNLCVDTQYSIQQMKKSHNCHFSKRRFKPHVYIIESLDYIKTPYVNTIHLNKTRI